MNNLYEILGVNTSASMDDIKKSYRKLAMEHHPDRGGDEERFKSITDAYSVLSDNQKRREYDLSRARPQHRGFSMEEIFQSMINQQRAHQQYRQNNKREQPKPTKDSDLRFKLGVTLEQIKRGVSQKINFQRDEECSDCSGVGGEGKMECGICQGTGVEAVSNGMVIRQFPCRMCRNRGILFDKVCNSCQGAGITRVLDSVTVEIKKI